MTFDEFMAAINGAPYQPYGKRMLAAYEAGLAAGIAAGALTEAIVSEAVNRNIIHHETDYGPGWSFDVKAATAALNAALKTEAGR